MSILGDCRRAHDKITGEGRSSVPVEMIESRPATKKSSLEDVSRFEEVHFLLTFASHPREIHPASLREAPIEKERERERARDMCSHDCLYICNCIRWWSPREERFDKLMDAPCDVRRKANLITKSDLCLMKFGQKFVVNARRWAWFERLMSNHVLRSVVCAKISLEISICA